MERGKVVMIAGNRFLVRTSVSVLAMVLSASMALADDETPAGTADETAVSEPEVISCELYRGPEVMVEEPEYDDTEGPDVDLTGEDGGELVRVFDVDSGVDENGEEISVYYMTGGPADDPEMVRRNVVLTTHAAGRASVAHDPTAVPNLCEIAGPGLDWLCGAKAQ